MKKIILALCVFMSLSLFGETVKIAYFQLEPYVISGNETTAPTGIIVDFWENHIAPAMGVDVEWVGPYPFPRIERMMETGEVDAAFLMIKTPPRIGKFLFAENPFIFMQPGLTLRKDDPMAPLKNLEEIYGLKLAYVDGASLPPYLQNENIILDNATQTDYKSVNFKKLLRNRVDAILDLNMLSNKYEAEIRDIEDQIRIIPLPVDPTPMFAAFSNTATGKRFLQAYNSAHKGISSNTIDNLIAEYSN